MPLADHLDLESYKLLMKGILKSAYASKRKDLRKRLADYLRNLADDLDAEYVQPEGSDPDAT